MHRLKYRSLQGWPCRLLIVIAIFSLAVSLATRFVIPTTSHTRTVKSVSRCLVEPQRQRLNRDAVQWAAPVLASAFVEPVVYPPVAPPEPQLAIQFFDDSTYNRPPPSLAFLL